MKRAKIISAAFALLALTGGTSAIAAGEGALQGAWTMAEADCSQVFEQSDGKMKFIERDSSLNNGIIVRGDTMMGPHSTCTIGRITKQEDLYKVHLMCATAIMFDDISVLLKVIDDDHFERFDPDFPEVTRKYQRCSP